MDELNLPSFYAICTTKFTHFRENFCFRDNCARDRKEKMRGCAQTMSDFRKNQRNFVNICEIRESGEIYAAFPSTKRCRYDMRADPFDTLVFVFSIHQSAQRMRSSASLSLIGGDGCPVISLSYHPHLSAFSGPLVYKNISRNQRAWLSLELELQLSQA